MKIREILKRMLLTRKCILCDDVIDYEREEPFCDDCMERWDNHLDIRCNRCGQDRFYCSCLPLFIKKNIPTTFWSVFYNSGGKDTADAVVYSLKYERRRETIMFCALTMKKTLIENCKKHNINYKDFAITYAPRRKCSIRRYMLDHSREVAKQLAKMLGLDFVEALSNIGKEEQKTLTRIERRNNAMRSYELKRDFVNKHKKYFLVDDIMTTGSTLLFCSRLLYEAGANEVIPITYAKDNYSYNKGEN